MSSGHFVAREIAELAWADVVVGDRSDPRRAAAGLTGWPIASHILRTCRLRPS